MNINTFRVLQELGKVDLKEKRAIIPMFVEGVSNIFYEIGVKRPYAGWGDAKLITNTVSLLTGYPNYCTDDRQVAKIVRALVIGCYPDAATEAVKHLTYPFLDEEDTFDHFEKHVSLGVLIGLMQAINANERCKDNSLTHDFFTVNEWLVEIMKSQIKASVMVLSKTAELLALPDHNELALADLRSAVHCFAGGTSQNREERFGVVQDMRKQLLEKFQEVERQISEISPDGAPPSKWSEVGTAMIVGLTQGSFELLDTSELLRVVAPEDMALLKTVL